MESEGLRGAAETLLEGFPIWRQGDAFELLPGLVPGDNFGVETGPTLGKARCFLFWHEAWAQKLMTRWCFQ